MVEFEFVPRCQYAKLESRVGACLDSIKGTVHVTNAGLLCENCYLYRRISKLNHEISLNSGYGIVSPYATRALTKLLEQLGKNKVYDVGSGRIWRKYMDDTA